MLAYVPFKLGIGFYSSDYANLELYSDEYIWPAKKWHFNPFLFSFSLGCIFANSLHVLKSKCGKKICCLLSKRPDLAGGLKNE